MTTTVDIAPFNYRSIKTNSFITLVAKRRGGKSTWATEINQNMPGATEGTVICLCGSEKTKQYWCQYVPPLFVHDGSVELLQKIIDQQQNRKRKPIKIIIDDMGFDTKFMKSKPFKFLTANGRQIDATLTVCIQYFNQMPPDARAQIDLFVLLSTADKTNVEKSYREFASCCDLEVYKSIHNAVTDDFGALIIDNTRHASSINNICFYGKVEEEPIPKRQLGSRKFIEYCQQHYLDMEKVKTRVQQDILEEDDDHLSDHTLKQALEMFDNKKVFTHSKGKIIIRKLTVAAKSKIE